MGDLRGGLWGLLVLRRARAGDDREPREHGELATHLVGDAIGEVFICGRAQVLKGKHREARGGRTFPIAVGSAPGEQDAGAEQEADDKHGEQRPLP